MSIEPSTRQERQGRRGLWWAGAALTLLVWLVITRRTELAKLLATLERGQWEWVLAAAVLQVAFYTVYTALYQSAFAACGVSCRLRDLLAPMFQSLVVNVAAPGAGVGVLLNAALRCGGSPARAAAGAILVRLADFGTFVLILVAALVHLFLVHDLRTYEVAAAAVLLASTIAWALALLIGLWHPKRLQTLLAVMQRAANSTAARLGRPGPLPAGWAERQAGDFGGAAAAIAENPAGLVRTVGVALSAHALDLASLYALFLAFHQPVPFANLVTGFAIGILFWVVSITPQGIGVVEGVMTLVFSQLGVPLERAAVIALSFRGLTFWFPLLVGFAMMHRLGDAAARALPPPSAQNAHSPGRSATRRARRATWSVRAVAMLTLGVAAVDLLSAVQPALRDRLAALAPVLPLVVRHGARLASALAGFALLVLAFGLLRRKRAAWWLTMCALGISAAGHLVKGLDYEEATLALLLMVWLAALRGHFHARSDAPSVAQGVRIVILAAIFSIAYGVAGFYLLDRHFRVDFGLGAALRQTLVMFTEFSNPGLEPITGFGRYFAASIYIVAAVTMGFGLYMVLRPVLLHRGGAAVGQARAQAIVEDWGRSSLARLTLLPDKTWFLTPGGSMVAYVVKGRIALALGDPIGPPEDIPSTVAAFRALCALNDWQPAFYQTLPDHLETYRAEGFSTLHIGNEAIVDLSAFTLEGGANKSIRTAMNRVTREGFTAELLDPPLSQKALEELRDVSDEWLTTVHGAEKGFSLGWFETDYIRTNSVMVVRAPTGESVAFANIIPEYQHNEVSFDLMRRRRNTPGGITDFLFVHLFLWARERGYATFNLGLSPLAGVGETFQDPAVERALHFIYEHVNQFYSFRGLHAFKEKFHPVWSPRYLVYPGLASLPPVAIAILRADGGDFFVWDALQGLAPGHRTAGAPA